METEIEVPVTYCAGGVVARVHKSSVEIVLIRDTTHQGFIIPKGHLYWGESPEEGAIRETTEETGIESLTILANLGYAERLSSDNTEWKVTDYYLLSTDQRVIPEPEEYSSTVEAKWFLIDRLPKMHWSEQRSLIEKNRARIKRLISTHLPLI